MSRLVIIDGNAIVHRAYHAIPPMHTKAGVLVNAVYGFTSMIFKVFNDLKPTHFAMTFDVAGGSHARLKRFAEYKGTRVKADQELYDQIPLVHEVVRALGFPVYEKTGYEADDVIGTIVQSIRLQTSDFRNDRNDAQLQSEDRSPKTEVYIVTGDKDTLQLVSDNIKVYTLRKGLSDTVVYDAAAVRERFGFGPDKMVDFKALAGDSSDNISGVPGIGEKTATELIKKFSGIEEIYQEIKKTSSRLSAVPLARGNQKNKLPIRESVLKKLIDGEEKARMSYELAKIDCAVPDLDFKLSDCAIKPFDRAAVAALFQKFEFVSLLKRLPAPLAGPGAPTEAKSKKIVSSRSKKEVLPLNEVTNVAEAKKLAQVISAEKQFACRTLWRGPDIFSGSLQGLVFVTSRASWFLPAAFVEPLLPLFSDSTLTLVGHDLKQLVKQLSRAHGIAVSNQLFDVMVASYLLQPGTRAHDAPSVILKVLGVELPAASGQESLFGIDYKTAAHELTLITRAARELKTSLEAVDNLGLLQKIEMPLIPVLADMELAGIAIDQPKLAALAKTVAADVKKVSQKIFKLAGTEFNISSPLQLREILFEKLDIPALGIKKGKTGLSTDAEQLEKLQGLHPVISEISEYRELTKLQNTYIDVLPTLVNKITGRVHTTFNQAVAATGRLSSSDPNLQNIPIRSDLGAQIRQAFIAEPGNVLVSADYSQIELRIVASLAEDKKMMEIFDAGLDIHTATAAAIHNVPLKDVTKELRRSAKEINFGILYGMGAYGLAWRAEIPQAAARDFIKKYFEEFAGVKKYIDRTLEFTRKEGYCETLFGRRRYIPELNASNFQLRAQAERMAINHPVQGTAADLMKLAMIDVHKRLQTSDFRLQTKMILQVHDELVLEVNKKNAEEVGALVKKIMEGVVKLRVPVAVEVHSGRNWGELH